MPAEDEAGKSQLRTTLALYDERKITFEQDHFTQMNLMLKELEAAVGADIEILALHATMREDKLPVSGKRGWDGVLAEHDKVVRNKLSTMPRLFSPSSGALRITNLWRCKTRWMGGQSVNSRICMKLRVKQQVVIVQDRMLVGSEQLDQLLTETPEDFEVQDWGQRQTHRRRHNCQAPRQYGFNCVYTRS